MQDKLRCTMTCAKQCQYQHEKHLQFVIEAQLDIWHAAQEDLHHNLAIHIAPQHCALVAHQHVHLHKTDRSKHSMSEQSLQNMTCTLAASQPEPLWLLTNRLRLSVGICVVPMSRQPVAWI